MNAHRYPRLQEIERTCPRSPSLEVAESFSGKAREKHRANNPLLGREAVGI